MNTSRRVFARIISCSVVFSLLLTSVPAVALAQDEPVVQEQNLQQQDSLAQEQAPECVGIVNERTNEYCTTYEMSDGTYRAEVSQTPINYQDKDGTWKEIDTALSKESTTAGQANNRLTALSPNSLEEDLKFIKQVSGASPVTLQGDGYFLTINMLGVCEGIPQAEGSVSTYENVAQSTNLSYEVLSNGIKETLYLSDANAPTEFSFNMRLSGLTSQETSRGLALFKEGEAEPLYTFGDLVVFDASKNEADEPSYDTSATMTYEKTASGLTFTYHISKEWLQDPERVFPVQVDPTLTKNASDTFISSAFPSTNYATSSELKVGRYDSSTGYNRALIKFGLSEIPTDAYVESAALKLYQTHTYYTNTDTTAYLGLMKKNWSASGTWSSLNCAKGDTRTFDEYLSKSYAGRDIWVTFNVLSAVRDWASGEKINNGFCLYQTEGAAAQEPECWRKFASANASAEHKPKLVVKYTLPQVDASIARTLQKSPDRGANYPNFNDSEEIAYNLVLTGDSQDKVTSIRSRIVASNGDKQGLVAWLRDKPDSTLWSYAELSQEQGGGYIARYKDQSSGYSCIKLVPTKCSSLLSGTGDSAKRTVKVVLKAQSDFNADVHNRIDASVLMAGGYNSGYSATDARFCVVPARENNGIVSVETTASTKYFKLSEKYPLNDTHNFNNEADAGRGSISLSWQKNPRATGYKIAFFDGEAYREVADIPSADITSWSSSASGLFPQDLRFKSAAQDSVTATDLFAGAQSPSRRIGTDDGEIDLSEIDALQNAGTVASNGAQLFVHTYIEGDSTQSPVVVSDLQGNAIQELNFSIPNDTRSLISVNNTLYTSRITKPDTLSGVRVDEQGDEASEKLSYLRMERPFLDEMGNELSASAIDGQHPTNILVGANDDYIVNAARVSNGTLKVRLFKDDGSFVCDKVLPDIKMSALESITLDDLGNIICAEKAPSNRIIKCNLESKKLSEPLRFITVFETVRVDEGHRTFAYVASQRIFVSGFSQEPILACYAGPGYDLSDSPNELYKAVKNTSNTNPEYYNDKTNYAFTVVPYNAYGHDYYAYQADATRSAVLEGRSVVTTDRTQRNTCDDDMALGLSKEVVLPQATLRLSREIASLNSYGPEVSLSLAYHSSEPTDTASILGNGALSLIGVSHLAFSASGNYLYYFDEENVRHTLSAVDDEQMRYISSVGSDEEILRAGSGWRLVTHERDVLFFDEEGKLVSHSDRNQNTVAYEYEDGRPVSVEAANGQRITLSYTQSGALSALAGPGIDVEVTYGPHTTTICNNLTHAEHTFTFDERGLLASLSDADGNSYIPSINDARVLESEYFVAHDSNKHLRETTYQKQAIDADTRAVIVKRMGAAKRYITNAAGQILSESLFVEADEDESDFDDVACTTYEFDRAGNEIASREQESASPSDDDAVETSVYDARGNALFSTTPEGRITKNTYNDSNDLIKTVDPNGQVTWNTFDAHGNLLVEQKLINDSGQKARTEYTYDLQGDIKGVCTQKRLLIDRDAQTWATTRYSDFDEVTGEPCSTTEEGIDLGEGSAVDITKTSEYDARGNLVKESDALGAQVRYVYDSASRQIKEIDARGKESVSVYDKCGNVVESYEQADGDKRNWTKTTYSLFGDPILERTFDEDGNERSRNESNYDDAGNLIESDSNTIAGSSQSTYDAEGNELTQTQEGLAAGAHGVSSTSAQNDATVEMTYDSQGQITSSKEIGQDTRSETTYSDDGEVLMQKEADGSYDESIYDETTGELEQTISHEGDIVEETSFFSDYTGNVVKQKEPDGARAHYAYDLLGRVTSAQMPGSKETITTYNALGWVLRSTERYIAADQKAGIPTQDLELITEYVYDQSGHIIKKTYVDDETTYTYNAAGDVTSQHNPDGSSINDTYNAFGEVVRHVEHATDQSLAHDIAYTFDDQGRELSATDSADYGLSSETTYTIQNVANGSDRQGERESTTITLPHFSVHTQTNDSQQFESATLSNETSDVATLEVATRDGAGRILALTSSLLSAPITRTFDEVGRLSTQSFVASETQSYSYLEDSSKLSGWNVGGIAEHFAYDSQTGRLAETDDATYEYSPHGATPLQTLKQNAQSTPAGSLQDYDFNAKGQRTRSLVATQSASLSWAGERLASLETSGTHADYTYDASGMRIKTRLVSQGKEQTLRYTYDELRLYEVASSGDEEFIIGYLYEDTNQTPTSASYETSGTCVPFSLESNVRGDVVALRDAGGEVFARYIYSEYGVLKNLRTNATALIDEPLATQIAHNQLLRYAGYVYDEYSQMYYCSARYYDPATQVFISIDPARADAERSGYLYCSGDPVNNVDPSGLQTSRWGYCQSCYVIPNSGPRTISGSRGAGDIHYIFAKLKINILVKYGRKFKRITKTVYRRIYVWIRKR